jgi:hypothetical protein
MARFLCAQTVSSAQALEHQSGACYRMPTPGTFLTTDCLNAILEKEKCMDVNKLAGACLIILGTVNVLHEFVVRSTGRGEPGFAYALVTALFFTFGVVLLLQKRQSPPGLAKR